MFKHTYCGNIGGLRVQSDPVGPTPGHYAYFRLFVQWLLDIQYCK